MPLTSPGGNLFGRVNAYNDTLFVAGAYNTTGTTWVIAVWWSADGGTTWTRVNSSISRNDTSGFSLNPFASLADTTFSANRRYLDLVWGEPFGATSAVRQTVAFDCQTKTFGSMQDVSYAASTTPPQRIGVARAGTGTAYIGGPTAVQVWGFLGGYSIGQGNTKTFSISGTTRAYLIGQGDSNPSGSHTLLHQGASTGWFRGDNYPATWSSAGGPLADAAADNSMARAGYLHSADDGHFYTRVWAEGGGEPAPTVAQPMTNLSNSVTATGMAMVDGTVYVLWAIGTTLYWVTSTDGATWSSPSSTSMAGAFITNQTQLGVVKIGATHVRVARDSASGVWTDYAASGATTVAHTAGGAIAKGGVHVPYTPDATIPHVARGASVGGGVHAPYTPSPNATVPHTAGGALGQGGFHSVLRTASPSAGGGGAIAGGGLHDIIAGSVVYRQVAGGALAGGGVHGIIAIQNRNVPAGGQGAAVGGGSHIGGWLPLITYVVQPTRLETGRVAPAAPSTNERERLRVLT